MKINPLYKDVPFIHEKLKVLKQNIISDRATLARWIKQEPGYPLLIKVKDQLEANVRIWASVVEDVPCP